MSRYGSLVWLALIAALVYGLDQSTKAWVVAGLGPDEGVRQVDLLGSYASGSWLRIVYSTNTGGSFGMFQDGALLFTVVSVLALPLLVLLRRYLPLRGWPVTLCFGLFFGGVLGNLTDRLRLGQVVDFIDGGVSGFHWATFNVADSAYVIGAFVLGGLLLFYRQPRASAPEEPASGQ